MDAEAEQALKDDLERMIAQEIVAKDLDDATRQAFEEEKKRAAQATSINKLNSGRPSISTSNSPLVSTANTPYASAASTPTGTNTVGSSFVYLGGQIPIDASTLPNADLHIDLNMPDLEDGSNVFPNDGIFSGAYNDEDVGAEVDFNNMDNTIDVWILVDLPFRKKAISTKWVFRNKRDERSIVVKNKARLVAQGFRHQEGIDYDEVFAPVAKIEAIRLFLAFASFIGFPVYQMNVKSAFLYGTIEEEVYVHQPPGFIDPAHPNKVYKVIKALYGLHQALRACSTTQSMCIEFEDCMHKRFQMSSMGELTFFLGLQVKQKPNEIFIGQDKYVANILKKFNFCSIKPTTTPIESNKPLVKDEDGVDVDVHVYRSMIGSLAYLTASRPDIMFVVYVCARFQVTLKASHLNAVKRIFRDCYKKRLIDVIKIHTNANVIDLLTKGFDVTRFKFLVANLVLPDKFGAARKKFVLFVTVTTVVSMANLEFVDQHNMVACLAKTEGNSNFHKIVDFLASSSIHHTLTIDATIDSKAVVVTEASIRSSLLFNDADAHNLKVFTNMSRKGLKFSGKVTPLFDYMLVPNQAPEGEGSDQPTEPQSTPSPTQPSTGGQPPETSPSHVTTQDSRDSLEGTDGNEGDQVQTPHDSPFLGGHTSDKAEGALNLQELSVLYHVMEYMKTEEAVDEGRQSGDNGGNAKELVSTARPELSTATPNVNAARQEDSAVKPRTPPTKTSIFEDEDITIAQTLIKMKDEKAKEKGVSFKDVKDSSRLARSTLTLKPLLIINPKDKGKSILEELEPKKKMTRSDFDAAQIARDAEIARQLQVDLQAKVERERQREEKASKAAIAEMYDEVQAGIDADALFIAKLQ
ncbi:retrovirus-related pol polyprotein from transposon TNT 1-94 [Tanacetum coccineum]